MITRELAVAEPSKRFDRFKRLAYGVANNYCRRRGILPQDCAVLANTALIALHRACRSYDDSRGVPLAYWIKRRVWGMLMDYGRTYAGIRRRRYWRVQRGEAVARVFSLEDPESLEVRSACSADDPRREVTIRDEVNKILEMLTDTERRVVHCLYWRGLTMRETGLEMGFTESYVCKVHTGMVARIRRRLGVAA